MGKVKLTKAQVAFLRRAERETYPDNSGQGAMANDGYEQRTAAILSAKGLVWAPAVWGTFVGARITPAGRAALSEGER